MATCFKPYVYVASYYVPNLAEMVRVSMPDVHVIKIEVDPTTRTIYEDAVKSIDETAEVLFCDAFLINQILKRLPNLKWVQARSSGVNHIDMTMPPSYILTRATPGSRLIGEYVMTYILAIEKKLFPAYEAQKQKQWTQREMGDTNCVTTRSICILGLGSVGKEVARRCKQLGMNVTGVVRTLPTTETKSEHVDLYVTGDQLSNVLSACNYICCCVPSTPATKNLLSGDLLSVCQKTKPILISVGRGDIIDEPSLIQALTAGWLGGAVLDVFPKEPLPSDSPLWSLPNVIITPHVSGYSRSPEVTQSYIDIFLENYKRYRAGQPLLYVVDYKQGY